MTDLLHVLPDFPTKSYTHLIPSLEKNLITTADLLSLDAVEIARRARLPVLDVRRLASHIIALLQQQLGLEVDDGLSTSHHTDAVSGETAQAEGSRRTLRTTGHALLDQWSTISTLDTQLDTALGGGIPTGYLTEITGER